MENDTSNVAIFIMEIFLIDLDCRLPLMITIFVWLWAGVIIFLRKIVQPFVSLLTIFKCIALVVTVRFYYINKLCSEFIQLNSFLDHKLFLIKTGNQKSYISKCIELNSFFDYKLFLIKIGNQSVFIWFTFMWCFVSRTNHLSMMLINRYLLHSMWAWKLDYPSMRTGPILVHHS